MKTKKAITLVALSAIALGVCGQTKDSLRANNYPSIMPYVPKTPDYKNTHLNPSPDTAARNAHRRAVQADSDALHNDENTIPPKGGL